MSHRSQSIRRFSTAAVGALCLATLVKADEPIIDWSARERIGYDSYADKIRDSIRIDSAGRITVAHNSERALSESNGIRVKRISSDKGRIEWESFLYRRYHVTVHYDRMTFHNDMEVDGDGNIYFLGNFAPRYTVGPRSWVAYKLTASGTLLFEARGLTGNPTALAVHPDGRWVTSGLVPESNGDQLRVAFHEPNNTSPTWWWRIAGGQAFADSENDVAIASDGSVFLSATVGGTFRLIKFDSAGQKLWTHTLGNGYVRARKVIALPDGGCATLAEQSTTATSDDVDVLVSRYDADGNLAWRRVHDGPNNLKDYAKDLFVDSSDNIWALVNSHRTADSTDIMMLRYSPTGDRSARKYTGAEGDSSWAEAFAVSDDGGTAYVVGYQKPLGGLKKSLVLKYQGFSKFKWAYAYNEDGKNYWASDVAIERSGRAIVVGTRLHSNLTTAENFWFAIR